MLTHQDLLNMHVSIRKSYQISRKADQIIWKGLANDVQFLALFNASEKDTEMQIQLQELDVNPQASIFDIWNKQELLIESPLMVWIPKHGTVLLKIK